MKTKLMNNLKEAMKEKDTIRKNTIQLIRAQILQLEKDNQKELSNNEIIELIVKQQKQKQEALKEWFANKKQILDSNEEYKRNKKMLKSHIAACFLAPIVSILFFMNSWDKETAIIGTVIVFFSFIFPIIKICLYDSKCNEISGNQQKNYIENYIKEKRK